MKFAINDSKNSAPGEVLISTTKTNLFQTTYKCMYINIKKNYKKNKKS